MQGKCLDFFLAANSPQGFISRFDQLNNPKALRRCYIIKGTSGNGKSTVLRKAAQALCELGETVECIHCSSDPDSLDGILCERLGVSVVDGTAPHVMEPQYPCAFETVVNLFDAVDIPKVAARRDEVIALVDRNHQLQERVGRYLSAAGSLLQDNVRIGMECVDLPKVNKTALRLARRLFGSGRRRDEGRETVRFLSAVTNRGIVMFSDTATQLCERLYLLEDDLGCASRAFLSSMRGLALAAGQNVVACYCPMRPFEKIEHLLIPSAGIGFLTHNSFHRPEVPFTTRINCKRFMDTDRLKLQAHKLSFNRRATRELLAQASKSAAEAKATHDEIERIYGAASDFTVVQAKADALVAELRDAAAALPAAE